MKTTKKLQSGFTLVEIMLVVALAAGITAIAFIIGAKKMKEASADLFIVSLEQTIDAIHKTYRTRPDYSAGAGLPALSSAAARTLGLVPQTLFEDTGSGLVHPYGGPIVLSPATSVAVNASGAIQQASFNVRLENLVGEECVMIGERASRLRSVDIQVNGVAVLDSERNLLPATLVGACSTAATPPVVVISASRHSTSFSKMCPSSNGYVGVTPAYSPSSIFFQDPTMWSWNASQTIVTNNLDKTNYIVNKPFYTKIYLMDGTRIC